MRAKLLLICLVCATLGLWTGCASVPLGFQQGPETNLTQSSYAAADVLMQQSHAVIDMNTPIYVGVLTDMQDPAEVTAFGQMVASHIGARFVQLGYSVNISSFDEMMLMKEKAAEKASPATAAPAYAPASDTADPDRIMITGQYADARNEVLVNLRLVNPATGRVLAAYDYTLSKTSDIRSLLKKESDKKGFFSL